MSHHETKEELEEAKSFDFVYYIIGLVTGILTGAILDVGMIFALLGGVLGLLSTALYLRVFVKGSRDV